MKPHPLSLRYSQERARDTVLAWTIGLVNALVAAALLLCALSASGCRRGDLGQRPPEPPSPVVGPMPVPEPPAPPVKDTTGEINRYYEKFRALDAAANEEAANQVEAIGLPAARKLLGQRWVELLKNASEERRTNEAAVIGQGPGAIERAKALWLKRAEECRGR